MKKNYLILIINELGLFPEKLSSNDIYIKNMLIGKSILLRIIRKIHLNSFLPLKSIWFKAWLNIIKRMDIIIIFDSGNAYAVAKYIKKKYPNKHIIMWFWNPVAKTISPLSIKNEICEKWSFDKNDCEKYNMKYNTTFYFKHEKFNNKEAKYDVFFIGSDKGRVLKLLDLENIFKKYGISTYFHITASIHSNINEYKQVYKPKISYDQVLEYIAECKIILDIVSENQQGMTLRPFEALFYHKKLITNYKQIKTYDFYNKNNIFILGEDKIEDLLSFVNRPYNLIDQKIIDRYDISSWIKRFN